MRIKKFYNEGLNPTHNKHSSIGNYNNLPPTSNDGLTGRASTSNDIALGKSLNGRNDLTSAKNIHLRDAVSTRGGMSFIGGRSEFPQDDPPFLILPD